MENFTDSSISLAKVTTIPRCRDSIVSNTFTIPSSTTQENSHAVVSSAQNFAIIPATTTTTNDDTKMTSFFQPISVDNNTSPTSSSDNEARRNSSRLPLEAVPELSEVDIINSHYSYPQLTSSTVQISHHSNSVEVNPVLITFDSNSLQRRT